MRILAIRGEGLASLADPFEIDLTREPLSGTGLFAITGDTGAGKSTILDCLCLALYGEYPRIAAGRTERLIDPSGQTITAANPVNIMRRGAAYAVAEVDFVGRDGVACRARWQVRRARGRADGRPQEEERRLERLDGSGTIASRKNEVARQIVERTGLTFDQFRRTVLLAQGEFDAFLLADEREQADLLEKITGTGIYAEISRRVHSEARRRNEAVNLLKSRRDGLEVLSEAARSERARRRTELAAERAALTRELAEVNRRLMLAGQYEEVRERLEAARSALDRVLEAQAAAEPDRARLACLERVEPLRPAFEAVQAARQEVASRRDAWERLRALYAPLEARAVAEAARLDDLEAEVESVLRDIADLAPQWEEAERADHALAAARVELSHAQAACDKAARQHREARNHLKTLAASKAELQSTLDRLRAAPELSPAAARLASEADRILSALEQRCKLQARYRETLAAAEQARAAVTATEERRQALIRDMMAIEQALAEQQRVRERLTTALSALDGAAAGEREPFLQAAEAAFKAARAALDDRARWAAMAQSALGRQAAAVARAAEAAAERAGAEQQRNAIRRALSEIVDLAVLADATQSIAAAKLRGLLKPGEPCPVCGSPEHPATMDSGEHMALAASVRARRTALAAEEAAINQAIEAATRAHANAEAEARAAAEAAAEAARGQARADACLRESLQLLTAHGGEPRDVTLLAAGEAEAIDARLGEIVRERRAFAEQRQQAERLRREGDVVREREMKLAKERTAMREALSRAEREQEAARSDEAATRARLEELLPRLADLERELVEPLTAAGIVLVAADNDSDHRHMRDEIERRVAAYHRALADVRAAGEALAALTADLAAAEAAERTLAAALAEATGERALREETVRERFAARRVLLAGVATAEHRAAAYDRRDAAIARRDRARDEAQRLALELKLLEGQIEAAREALAVAETAARRRHDEMAAGLAARGVDEGELAVLLAVDPDVRRQLAETLAALARQRADCEQAVAMRAGDLAALAASGADAIDHAAETERQVALTRQIELLGEEAARLAVQLESDDATRSRVAALDEEIATAAADALTWDEVDAAIGSADGSSFRRFAQGITLEHLVALANAELRRFAPRYALARSTVTDLTLHVIDDDLGGETRSLRSLSGGERFLVALALALALARLEGGNTFVDTLFIDEGFGALDAETLSVAIDALEQLQGAGRKVGIITHVSGMIDRIAVQVRVERRGGGRSVVRIGNEAPELPSRLLTVTPRVRGQAGR